MHRISLAALVSSAVIFIPATAGAVAIHVHDKVPVTHERIVGKTVDGPVTKKWTTMKEVVRVEHVAPADTDEDGIADSSDDCIGYCAPPAPAPETSYAAAPTESYSGAMPSMVQCESGGDPNAVDPSGTYWGLGQFDQSTWDAYAPSGEWGSASAEEQVAAINAVPYDAWPNC